MPFGLTNATAYFVDPMSRVYKGLLNRFVVVFVDDILIYSKSKEEHDMHLKEVLNILHEHKLKTKFYKQGGMPFRTCCLQKWVGSLFE